MVDRVDYYINENWDQEFTDWDDLRTVRDTDVLVQNFLLIAAENTADLVGKQITTTKLSRHKRRLEDAFTNRESVSYFSIQDVSVDGRELTYKLVIGSEEFEKTIYV